MDTTADRMRVRILKVGWYTLSLIAAWMLSAGIAGAQSVATKPSPTIPAMAPAAVAPRSQLAARLTARADEYTHQGRWDAALGLYQDAYQEQPEPGLLLAIGLCHVSLNHPDEAQAKCEAFIQTAQAPTPDQLAKLEQCRNGTYAVRKGLIGKQAYDAKNYDTARQAFEAAFALSPNPGFQLNVAKCYEAEGRWADMLERCEVFERALGNSANDQEAQDVKECKAVAQYELHRQQCLTLIAEHNYERAISSCQAVFEQKKDPPLLLRVGIAQAELQQFTAAQASCGQFAVLVPAPQRLVVDAALLEHCQRLARTGIEVLEQKRKAGLPKPWYKRPGVWVAAGAGVLAIGVTIGLAAGLTPQPYREYTW